MKFFSKLFKTDPKKYVGRCEYCDALIKASDVKKGKAHVDEYYRDTVCKKCNWR